MPKPAAPFRARDRRVASLLPDGVVRVGTKALAGRYRISLYLPEKPVTAASLACYDDRH